MASKGTEKTLQKLRESVNAGTYYEAHQMYRTVARRYNKQQKYGDTIRLLHDGAILLLQHKQTGSGSDLANYMLDTYKLAELSVDETSLDRIVEILNLLPPTEAGRKAFMNNAIRWTKGDERYPDGDPELHDFVGTLLYHEKKYNQAEDHLLLGTEHSAQLLGRLAYEWAMEEESVHQGIYLARVVLQYVAGKDIRFANLAFEQFIEAGNQPVVDAHEVRKAPADEPTQVNLYQDPWMNFTQLLLLTIQRDGSDLFMELKSKYQSLYGGEKNFVELMEDIGFVYFNIPKPKKQGNMLQEMMASLFSGGNETAPRIGAPKVDLD
ncbi:hypothetical protein BY458DRAFT_459250 [Sporodiniella umbellata]|nr:hypothetical protein BY458DRAFT_459250 [Sporodiniella umbellata]